MGKKNLSNCNVEPKKEEISRTSHQNQSKHPSSTTRLNKGKHELNNKSPAPFLKENQNLAPQSSISKKVDNTEKQVKCKTSQAPVLNVYQGLSSKSSFKSMCPQTGRNSVSGRCSSTDAKRKSSEFKELQSTSRDKTEVGYVRHSKSQDSRYKRKDSESSINSKNKKHVSRNESDSFNLRNYKVASCVKTEKSKELVESDMLIPKKKKNEDDISSAKCKNILNPSSEKNCKTNCSSTTNFTHFKIPRKPGNRSQTGKHALKDQTNKLSKARLLEKTNTKIHLKTCKMDENNDYSLKKTLKLGNVSVRPLVFSEASKSAKENAAHIKCNTLKPTPSTSHIMLNGDRKPIRFTLKKNVKANIDNIARNVIKELLQSEKSSATHVSDKKSLQSDKRSVDTYVSHRVIFQNSISRVHSTCLESIGPKLFPDINSNNQQLGVKRTDETKNSSIDKCIHSNDLVSPLNEEDIESSQRICCPPSGFRPVTSPTESIVFLEKVTHESSQNLVSLEPFNTQECPNSSSSTESSCSTNLETVSKIRVCARPQTRENAKENSIHIKCNILTKPICATSDILWNGDRKPIRFSLKKSAKANGGNVKSNIIRESESVQSKTSSLTPPVSDKVIFQNSISKVHSTGLQPIRPTLFMDMKKNSQNNQDNRIMRKGDVEAKNSLIESHFQSNLKEIGSSQRSYFELEETVETITNSLASSEDEFFHQGKSVVGDHPVTPESTEFPGNVTYDLLLKTQKYANSSSDLEHSSFVKMELVPRIPVSHATFLAESVTATVDQNDKFQLFSHDCKDQENSDVLPTVLRHSQKDDISPPVFVEIANDTKENANMKYKNLVPESSDVLNVTVSGNCKPICFSLKNNSKENGCSINCNIIEKSVPATCDENKAVSGDDHKPFGVHMNVKESEASVKCNTKKSVAAHDVNVTVSGEQSHFVPEKELNESCSQKTTGDLKRKRESSPTAKASNQMLKCEVGLPIKRQHSDDPVANKWCTVAVDVPTYDFNRYSNSRKVYKGGFSHLKSPHDPRTCLICKNYRDKRIVVCLNKRQTCEDKVFYDSKENMLATLTKYKNQCCQFESLRQYSKGKHKMCKVDPKNTKPVVKRMPSAEQKIPDLIMCILSKSDELKDKIEIQLESSENHQQETHVQAESDDLNELTSNQVPHQELSVLAKSVDLKQKIRNQLRNSKNPKQEMHVPVKPDDLDWAINKEQMNSQNPQQKLSDLTNSDDLRPETDSQNPQQQKQVSVDDFKSVRQNPCQELSVLAKSNCLKKKIKSELKKSKNSQQEIMSGQTKSNDLEKEVHNGLECIEKSQQEMPVLAKCEDIKRKMKIELMKCTLLEQEQPFPEETKKETKPTMKSKSQTEDMTSQLNHLSCDDFWRNEDCTGSFVQRNEYDISLVLSTAKHDLITNNCPDAQREGKESGLQLLNHLENISVKNKAPVNVLHCMENDNLLNGFKADLTRFTSIFQTFPDVCHGSDSVNLSTSCNPNLLISKEPNTVIFKLKDPKENISSCEDTDSSKLKNNLSEQIQTQHPIVLSKFENENSWSQFDFQTVVGKNSFADDSNNNFDAVAREVQSTLNINCDKDTPTFSAEPSHLETNKIPNVDYYAMEKEDIDNPAWEEYRTLTTDKARYDKVRKQWHSQYAPNPHHNLTVLNSRRKRCGGTLRLSNGRNPKRKAEGEILFNEAPNKRKCIIPSTFLQEQQLAELEEKYYFDLKKLEQNALEQEETARELHNGYRSDLENNFCNSGYGQMQSNWLYKAEVDSVKESFKNEILFIRNQFQNMYKKLTDAYHKNMMHVQSNLNEVKSFDMFYVGLQEEELNTCFISIQQKKTILLTCTLLENYHTIYS